MLLSAYPNNRARRGPGDSRPGGSDGQGERRGHRRRHRCPGRNHPADFGPPRHIHHRSDELFYVLDGEFQFLVGEQLTRATAGSFVFVPRRTIHATKIAGPGAGKAIVVFVPGGEKRAFDEFVALAAAQSVSRTSAATRRKPSPASMAPSSSARRFDPATSVLPPCPAAQAHAGSIRWGSAQPHCSADGAVRRTRCTAWRRAGRG
ncbi:cupin domain-containing protein [Pseudonocardia asaccharolytica]|uniref:cupin domain-containing protein n=1 Tax=Pseudonocardia asaccharolytica TaxID=54010 RepID=UPI0013767A3E